MGGAAPRRFGGREGQKIREIGLFQARMEGEGNLAVFKEDEEAAGNDAGVAEGLDVNDLVEDEDEEESRWDLSLGWGKTGKDKEKR
ncbi:hypothetical protein C1H46_021617 [Malus baccata]|uniref:Uncharacterized protein n=1 Tax=Malus baccata TaxID=106549 RepID=A0A540M223_MALBA|nr:hypothetical protein C1H46_021617 [Malus baccata]